MSDLRQRQNLAAMERLDRATSNLAALRTMGDGGCVMFGHGATFDVMTRIDDWFGSYMEKVAPGAFAKTLADGADVRALLNHDPNYVLGRTKSGTLSLKEDDIGLAYEVNPPDTQWARDLQVSMRRGDITGSSFGFRVVKDKWTMVLDPDGDQKNDMMDCRTLLECQLFDVSPVTYPAYAESESGIRSAFASAGLDFDTLARFLYRSKNELPLAAHDLTAVRALAAYLSRYLPAELHTEAVSAPGQPTHAPAPAEATEPTPSSHSASSILASFARLERSIATDDLAKLARF